MNLQTLLSSHLLPFILLLASFISLIGIKKIAWARLKAWCSSTSATWDDVLLQKIDKPVTALLVVAAASIALQGLDQDLRAYQTIQTGIKIALVLTGLWLLDRIISTFFGSAALTSRLSRNTKLLFLVALRFTLYSLSLLIVLDTFGVSITPILASLGVGSIAVALALQDTLGNFFSGLYLLADEPIRLGDFVRLEDGTEGTVEKISWRSTRIQLPAGNLVILPNSKISSALIVNFDLPNREMGFAIPIGVAYGTDLAKAEVVICEVAKTILQTVPGGVADFQPLVRYTTFADSSINLNAILRCKSVSDQHLIKHEFIKALHQRFMDERIEIPFPQRVVHTAER